MRSHLAVAVLSLGTLACTATAETIHIPWPENETAKSAVMAMTAESRTSIWAFDVVEPRRLRPDVAWSEAASAEVELLFYEQSLEQLGLASGVLVPVTNGSLIPKPRIAFATAVADSLPGDWREVDELSSAVRSARVPRDPKSLCDRFEVENKFGLGPGFDLAFALSLGPDVALVGTFEGRIFRVDVSGVSPVTDFPLGLPFGAVLRDELGRIWFAGSGGELWRGTITTEPEIRIDAVRIAVTSTTSPIRWMAGRAQPDIEIYTLSEAGVLEVFDGARFQALHQFSGGIGTKGGVATPVPGEVWAAIGSSSQVIRIRNGELEDVTPSFLSFGVTTLTEISGHGVYFSAGQGRVFHSLEPSGWEELTGSSVQLDIYTVQPLDEGLVIAGAFGFVAQYLARSSTFCPAEQLGSGSVRRVVELGDRYLLAEDKPISRLEASVTILKRTPHL